MEMGSNSFLLPSPSTNESPRLFPTFKKWGFQSVEIPVEELAHIDPAHVKRELDKHGLVCGTVCACVGPDRDLRRTSEQQQTALEYMLKLVDQMDALYCPKTSGPV